MILKKTNLPRDAAAVMIRQILADGQTKERIVTVSLSFHEKYFASVEGDWRKLRIQVTSDEIYNSVDEFLLAYDLGLHETKYLRNADLMITVVQLDLQLEKGPDIKCMELTNYLGRTLGLKLSKEEWCTGSRIGTRGTSTSYTVFNGDLDSVKIDSELEKFAADHLGYYFRVFFPDANITIQAGEPYPTTHKATVETFMFLQQPDR